jgi:sugar O-acyltransferase (sialic acid O-acetyltransferase NeuD family)
LAARESRRRQTMRASVPRAEGPGLRERVAILGAGPFAREVLDVFMACNEVEPRYEIVGFIDEDQAHWGMDLNGYPVLGGFDWFDDRRREDVRVVSGVGSPATKRLLVQKASGIGLQFCTVVHPTAVVTPFVEFGHGVVVTAGCIFTNGIKVADHVMVNLDCTIGHDCVIEEFASLAPGVHVSGTVRIGTGCEIGTGAAIIQFMTIGEWAVVGAGAVVAKDVPPNTVSVGVPAKVLKERPPGWQDQ